MIELRLCSVRRYYTLRLCSRLRLHLLLELLLLELCLLSHSAFSGCNRRGGVLGIPTIHERNLNFLGSVAISGRRRNFNTEHIAQAVLGALYFFKPATLHFDTIQEGAVHDVGTRRRGSQQDAVTLGVKSVHVGHDFKSLSLAKTCHLVNHQVLILRDFHLTRENLEVQRLILSVCRQQLQGCGGVV